MLSFWLQFFNLIIYDLFSKQKVSTSRRILFIIKESTDTQAAISIQSQTTIYFLESFVFFQSDVNVLATTFSKSQKKTPPNVQIRLWTFRIWFEKICLTLKWKSLVRKWRKIWVLGLKHAAAEVNEFLQIQFTYIVPWQLIVSAWLKHSKHFLTK